MAGTDTLLDRLRAAVGDAHVLTDPALRAGYETDWTGRYHGEAMAVVRPATTTEVRAVVAACAVAGVRVSVQGGNTGLVGGSVPATGSVLVSTRRMATIGELDAIAGQITAGAGATLADVAAAVHGSGWEIGVDLAARSAATIGGMAATNAGGVRVVRYGTMRANVVGIEAVLADGSVISHLGGLLKDNTGYDLAGLLCGSEGTLAIITAVRLRLVPEPAERVAAWIACSSWDDAVELAVTARRSLAGLDALEAVDTSGIALVDEQLGVASPFGPGAASPAVALLVECAGARIDDDALLTLAGSRPAVVATDGPRRRRLWAVRERQTEAIARLGVAHKLDVTVPLGGVARFAADVGEVVRATAPGSRVFLFGHLGDGNLHVNVVGPGPEDAAVDEAVLHLVAARGGSISAEHGIGRAKRDHLGLVRSPAEIAAFGAVKAALDPAGLLNPGVLLPGR